MPTLPSDTVLLRDSTGQLLGSLHLVLTSDDRLKGDCIFDIELEPGDQEQRSEARWLHKRRFQKVGEHRFKLADNGTLTVQSGDFVLTLEPHDEDELISKASQPRVFGEWE